MNEKYILFESHWGKNLKNICTQQNSDILTVILPGDGYTIEKPLLYYSNQMALELGLDVLCVNYGFQISHNDFDIETELDIIVRESEYVLKKCMSKNYKRIIFIGKSLGTIIQNRLSNELTEYEQVHVYLTPVDKTVENIVNYPCLLITGTEDKKINDSNMGIIAAKENIELIKIDGGNHRLEGSSVLKNIELLDTTMKELRKFMTKHLKE